jgi:tRNA-dihydrouridine synthase
MSHNFWASLPHPIFALAPMEDVTDTVFREVVLSVSEPQQLQVLFTEFCSTDGLCHPVGRDKVAHRLLVNPSERALLKEKGVKLVAQVWGARPERFRQAVQWISNEYDFDGIDINMGCPAKKIVRQGGCSALIATPDLAKEIILATKESTHLPVSVKTRTGIKTHATEVWLEHVFSCNPAAVTLHCRTQNDMSDGPADYQQMRVAVDLRNRMAPDIVLLGNGDLFTAELAHQLVESTGADGAMFGRGIFHNPWLFAPRRQEVSIQERIELLLKHATLYEQTWGAGKNFAILRRFFKIYVNQLPNAALLRAKLMETVNLEQVRGLVDDFVAGNSK